MSANAHFSNDLLSALLNEPIPGHGVEALSSEARAITPWLHAIYSSIRGVVRSSPDTFRCRRTDFENIVERAHLPDIGFDSDLLLTTGSQANFLAYDEDDVWPKVRLLGRLTAVTRGRVAA